MAFMNNILLHFIPKCKQKRKKYCKYIMNLKEHSFECFLHIIPLLPFVQAAQKAPAFHA